MYTPEDVRVLLARGRELLILRGRGHADAVWHLPGTERRPHETVAEAAVRCGQELGGILEPTAVLPKLEFHQENRAITAHLVLGRVVEPPREDDRIDARWILTPRWIEYHFEPISHELLSHYQAFPPAE